MLPTEIRYLPRFTKPLLLGGPMPELFPGGVRWWHCVLIFAAANLVSALPAGLAGDGDFYTRLRTPPFAPPDWLFPPVWLALNVASLVALWLAGNADTSAGGGADRAGFLWAEAAGWVLFAAFAPVFFGLRSLWGGAAVTLLSVAAAGASAVFAARLAAGPAAVGWGPFCLILPRLLWVAFAGYVSVATAALNGGT